MTISQVLPVFKGIKFGVVSTQAKRLEDSVRAGGNAYLTALLQMTQANGSIALANQALGAANRSILPPPLRVITYLTPPLTALLKKTQAVPEKIRLALSRFQDHLGTFFQIAAVVSSLALAFFGHALFAVSSLTMLGLGFLDRNGLLPLRVRHLLHKYNPILLVITGLFFGGAVDRIFASITCLSKGIDFYLARKNKAIPLFEIPPQGNLSLQEAKRLLQDKETLKSTQVNRKHIHFSLLPPIPQIDTATLCRHFDQIDWKRHIGPLRAKLKTDQRFTGRHGNPTQKTDRQLIDFATRSLSTFIDSVKKRKILEGEPIDYERLENYLKLIAKYVENCPDEIEKTDTLLRLAIEGGEYCGPGKFEVAEDLYALTTRKNPGIAFPYKLLFCLQDERNRWMQALYNKSFLHNPTLSRIGKITDWHDIHNYNVFLNFYGDSLGLRKAGAENDDTAIIDAFTKLVFSSTIAKLMQTAFWIEHSSSHLVDTVIEAVGTSKLPKDEAYSWWLNWIQRQKISAEEKETLKDELAEGRLFGEYLEEEIFVNWRYTQQLSPTFVSLMLLDMGILTIQPTSESKPAPHSSNSPA